jgi:hypothetical protein
MKKRASEQAKPANKNQESMNKEHGGRDETFSALRREPANHGFGGARRRCRGEEATGAEAVRRVPYIEPNQRDEVGEAPPFEVIGRKFGPDSEMLIFDLMGLHAEMNFALRRRDAANVALPLVRS